MLLHPGKRGGRLSRYKFLRACWAGKLVNDQALSIGNGSDSQSPDRGLKLGVRVGRMEVQWSGQAQSGVFLYEHLAIRNRTRVVRSLWNCCAIQIPCSMLKLESVHPNPPRIVFKQTHAPRHGCRLVCEEVAQHNAHFSAQDSTSQAKALTAEISVECFPKARMCNPTPTL